MDKAVPRPWALRRCSHGPPGSTDARRAEGTCGGPGQRTSETVRKGSSHKKSERANMTVKERVQTIRVWNMIQQHPEFAKEIGLTWCVSDMTREDERVDDINSNRSGEASDPEVGTISQ